jgi:hypothetical protein
MLRHAGGRLSRFDEPIELEVECSGRALACAVIALVAIDPTDRRADPVVCRLHNEAAYALCVLELTLKLELTLSTAEGII